MALLIETVGSNYLFNEATDATSTPPTQNVPFTPTFSGIPVKKISDNADFAAMETIQGWSQAGNKNAGYSNIYSKYTNENITGEYAIAWSYQTWMNQLYRLSDNHAMGQISRDTSGSLTHGLQEVNDVRWDRSGRTGTTYDIYFQTDFTTNPGKIIKQNVLTGASSNVTIYTASGALASSDHCEMDENAHYRVVGAYSTWHCQVLDLYTGTLLPGMFIPAYKPEGDVSPDGVWVATSISDPVYVSSGGSSGSWTGFQVLYKISDLAAGNVIPYYPPTTAGYSLHRDALGGLHDGWAIGDAGQTLYCYQNGSNDFMTAWDPLGSAWTATSAGTIINTISLEQMHSPDGSVGVHFGRIVNPTAKGWMLISTYASVGTWADNQIFMVEIKSSNPRIWRIGSTYNHMDTGGFTQAPASINAAATAVYVAGNWFGTTNADMYRITLPTNWESTLGGTTSAPTVVGATSNNLGTIVTVSFSKTMGNPTGKQAQFTVLVNGVANTVTAAALNSDSTKIDLTLTSSIVYGNSITVGYAIGTVVASDGGVLATFSAQTVVNNVSPTSSSDSTISGLNAYATPIDADVLPIVDVTFGITKKITIANTRTAMKGDSMSNTVQGTGEEATAAEIDAGTQAGGTSAELVVNPKFLKDSTYLQINNATDATASRAVDGTVYRNITGKPIIVTVTDDFYLGYGNTSQVSTLMAYIGATSTPATKVGSVGFVNTNTAVYVYGQVTFIVPNNYYYKVLFASDAGAPNSIDSWIEYTI